MLTQQKHITLHYPRFDAKSPCAQLVICRCPPFLLPDTNPDRLLSFRFVARMAILTLFFREGRGDGDLDDRGVLTVSPSRLWCSKDFVLRCAGPDVPIFIECSNDLTSEFNTLTLLGGGGGMP
eukprot:193562-Amorphochlora_amoeboformis.AAC.1